DGAVFLLVEAILGRIAVGADGSEKPGTVAARDHVLHPMMVDRAPWQVGDLDARSRDLRASFGVRKAHDSVGIGDVEVVADQRHADGGMKTLKKDGFGGPAVRIVAQKRVRSALGTPAPASDCPS